MFSKSKSYFNYMFHVFIDEFQIRSDNLKKCVICVFVTKFGIFTAFFYVKSTSQQASTSLSNCMKTQEKWERNVNTYDQCPSISSNACHAHHTYYYYLPLYKFKNDEEYAHTGISMESSIQPIVNKFFSDNNEQWTLDWEAFGRMTHDAMMTNGNEVEYVGIGR